MTAAGAVTGTARMAQERAQGRELAGTVLIVRGWDSATHSAMTGAGAGPRRQTGAWAGI